MPELAVDAPVFSRYTARDEILHPHRDRPRFNESVYFNFVAPGDSPVLGGVVRVGLRPVEQTSEFQICLVLADGNTLYWAANRHPLLTYGEGTSWHTGPLRIDVLDPGRSWGIEYASDETRLVTDPASLGHVGAALKASASTPCRASLRFEATRPLHTMNESGDMIPGEDAAKDHYEQFGLLHGTLEWGTESVELSGLRALRDHSWGPRNYVAAMSTMDWFTAHLPGALDIVGFQIRSRPDLPAQGVFIDDTGRGYVDHVEVDTPWDAMGQLTGPTHIVIGSGARRIRATATVERSLMIKHRNPDQVVHNSYSLVRYETTEGAGRGWLDLNRPSPRPA